MRFYEDYLIEGQPLLIPDADVTVTGTDLDASDAGRDESGVMHRIPVRYKVPVWSFSYSHLTEAEKQYMENLDVADKFGLRVSSVSANTNSKRVDIFLIASLMEAQ